LAGIDRVTLEREGLVPPLPSRHDPPMGHDRSPQATPDLFATTSHGEGSPLATKQVSSAQDQRHVLPKDLPNAVKHLSDHELDLLIRAAVEEAKRRGRSSPSVQIDKPPSKQSSRTDNRRQVEAAPVSLTRGQVNAVRAAFKAGVKPSLIARQFGISQSDVRRVLASDSATQGGA
jgi:hypothetical protein